MWIFSWSQSWAANSSDWTAAQINYSAHELSTCDESINESCSVTINTALLGCVEMLEAENAKLNYNVKRRNSFE